MTSTKNLACQNYARHSFKDAIKAYQKYLTQKH